MALTELLLDLGMQVAESIIIWLKGAYCTSTSRVSAVVPSSPGYSLHHDCGIVHVRIVHVLCTSFHHRMEQDDRVLWDDRSQSWPDES